MSSLRVSTAFFTLFCLLVGCAQGHCRRKTDQVQTAEVIADTTAEVPPVATSAKPTEKDRVYVYKYDGSLQCQGGKAISLEVMAKELKGITVFSSAKKPDGMMHIQVCGSITGMANVYEIPAKSLKAAESKGFKKWNFD